MTVVGIDLGVDGAMVVVRNIGKGPELCAQPLTWRRWNKRRWERYSLSMVAAFSGLCDKWRPRAVAFEEARSILGRRHVGVAQALAALDEIEKAPRGKRWPRRRRKKET